MITPIIMRGVYKVDNRGFGGLMVWLPFDAYNKTSKIQVFQNFISSRKVSLWQQSIRHRFEPDLAVTRRSSMGWNLPMW